MTEQPITKEKSPIIAQITVTLDDKDQLLYNKTINFSDVRIAALVVLDLENFVNELKATILQASRQAHETRGGHGQNYS